MDESKELASLENSNIPSIILDVNPDEEIAMFYHGLHNNKRPWQRNIILAVDEFQPLREILETGDIKDEDQEKQIIGNFLKGFREDNKDRIDGFIAQAQKELKERSGPALTGLAKLMDYEWSEDFPGYRVVPVLLPYSPFGENVFFFSILGAVQGSNQMDVLDIAIHEISHMIFYELLDKNNPELANHHDNNGINIPIDYLKEVLAPVLMNQPSLRKLLDLRSHPSGYIGNPDLGQMYVQVDGTSEKVQISKYFQQLYENLRYREQLTFPEIMNKMIKLIQPMENELLKRKDLWDKHEFEIFRDQSLLQQYSQPIPIQL